MALNHASLKMSLSSGLSSYITHLSMKPLVSGRWIRCFNSACPIYIVANFSSPCLDPRHASTSCLDARYLSNFGWFLSLRSCLPSVVGTHTGPLFSPSASVRASSCCLATMMAALGHVCAYPKLFIVDHNPTQKTRV